MAVPEEYKLAIERQEQESSRYWSRSNIMLIVQAALISFFVNIYNVKPVFGLITATEGFFLSLIWLGVINRGKKYINRWDYVIKQIEECERESESSCIKFPINTIYSNAKIQERNIWPFPKSSTTHLMKYAVISTLLFWFATFCISLNGTFISQSDKSHDLQPNITSVEGSTPDK